MNFRIFATTTFIATTTLLQACSAEQMYYLSLTHECAGNTSAYCQEKYNAWAEYEADLAEWEACESRNAGAPPGSYYCGAKPYQPR